MSDSGKFTDKATDLAGQAAAAANQAKDKAADLAGQAALAAGPMIEKAAQLMGQALGAAADNIGTVADRVDAATKGKYTSQIKSAQSKVEGGLRKAADSSADAAGTPTSEAEPPTA